MTFARGRRFFPVTLTFDLLTSLCVPISSVVYGNCRASSRIRLLANEGNLIQTYTSIGYEKDRHTTNNTEQTMTTVCNVTATVRAT